MQEFTTSTEAIARPATMAHRDIEFNGKPLTVHKATIAPEFNAKTVLVPDTWDYIDLWLKRHRLDSARFFWDQARHFAFATRQLPKESSPLTAYYCMLNAAKALLIVRVQQFSDQHGVTGETTGARCSISNEIVEFKTQGILPALCRLIGETVNGERYSLCDLFYNLVYIHRAFSLSLPSRPELFLPIHNPRIVRSRTTNESWFCADLDGMHANMHSVRRLGNKFERDHGVADRFTVRRKKRFEWIPRDKAASIERYGEYHRGIRADLAYIHGDQRLWYLKRGDGPSGYIPRSAMTISFAAMHRLSELARYSPDQLARHFDGRYNWLLSEFISVAPAQFIDNISSEMTGYEFMPPMRTS